MEIWKDCVGYESLYQVSNLGNVKSLNYNHTKKEKFLKQGINWGYKRVHLFNKDKIKKSYRVHKLVAEAFICNPENKVYVNHLDGDKSNNNVNNLEWCTAKENCQHAILNNLFGIPVKGENHCRAKLKEKEVLEIRKSKLKVKEIAKLYNISLRNVRNILARDSWKHI